MTSVIPPCMSTNVNPVDLLLNTLKRILAGQNAATTNGGFRRRKIILVAYNHHSGDVQHTRLIQNKQELLFPIALSPLRRANSIPDMPAMPLQFGR